MKKFLVYLSVIVVAVSLGFAVFFLVRDNELISISNATIYTDVQKSFTIDVNHYNKKSGTKITISVSDEKVISYDSSAGTFTAQTGGIARVNFRTTNVKFRNLWCDVIVGDGTIESPFYISTPEQLGAIGMGKYENGVYAGSVDYPLYTSDACYKLVADIDVKDLNGGYWIPFKDFSGRFDGNGYTIRNVNIDRDGWDSVASQNAATYNPNYHPVENVGLFQKVTSTGMVYNLKIENFNAVGTYDNFGTIAGINNGLIERIEVKDATIGVETKVAFGGLVGKNISSEEGSNEEYVRNIARIDRCSVNMTYGLKTIPVNDQLTTVNVDTYGSIGGLVGENHGGTIVYSYSKGEMNFDDDDKAIVYGGIVGKNAVLSHSKYDGKYTSIFQGANIKDCYANIKTTLKSSLTHSNSRFAGAIGINTDVSEKNYNGDTNKKELFNYIIGVYYNKDAHNATQENITKNYIGIGEFKVGTNQISFADEKTIVCGLTLADMKVASNYLSHVTQDIAFDENGVSIGVQDIDVLWLFGTVWAMDEENDGLPYLNYQLVYIPDDFRTAGVAILFQDSKYTFEKHTVDSPIEIIGDNNGRLSIMKGTTYQLSVSPAGVSVAWTTSEDYKVDENSKILKVDGSGKITALNVGSATVTATTLSGYTDKITVIVTEIGYVISNYPTILNIYEGESHQLSGILVSPATTLTYLSKNSAVATVTSTGAITAISQGSTVIVVKAGTTEAYVAVNVFKKTTTDPGNSGSGNQNPSPSLPKDVTIYVKQSNFSYPNFNYPAGGRIEVTSVMCNGVDVKSSVDLVFLSSNTSVVAVDNTGLYTVIGVGTAEVMIVVNDASFFGYTRVFFEATAPQTPPASIEDFKFTYHTYTINVGDYLKLDYYGTTQQPTFTSANSAIASVDSNGWVQGIAPGTVAIGGYIIGANGISYSDVMTITVNDVKQMDIQLSANNTYVTTGSTVRVTATANLPTSFTWYSSSNNVTLAPNGDTCDVTLNVAEKVIITAVSTVDPNASASITLEAYDNQVFNNEIWNYDQLNNVRNNLDGDYILKANIVMPNEEWIPIGTKSKPFTGSLISHTGAFTISNMQTVSSDYSGLFGYIKDATIDGIIVSDADIVGDDVGGIAGYARNSQIANCLVSSSNLQGSGRAGGIVGTMANDTVISNCVMKEVDVAISAQSSTSKYVGGIAGYVVSGSIYSCKVNTSKSVSLGSGASGYAGGIVGRSNGNISGCEIIKANIIANNTDSNYAGGIAGYTSGTISTSVIKNSSITGYYAGGIAGTLNDIQNITLKFNSYKDSYRKSDLKSYSYSTSVSEVAVKSDVSVTGEYVGGLMGVIKSGVVSDSYTMASLSGSSRSAVKGGFASLITSTGFTNEGGTGSAGIVENCYTACTFSGQGDNYSITSSLVHNYQGSEKISTRDAGYCFNYLFDNDVDGRATYHDGSNVFAKDKVESKKSTAEMQAVSTYTAKGFSSAIWNIRDGSYATLKSE